MDMSTTIHAPNETTGSQHPDAEILANHALWKAEWSARDHLTHGDHEADERSWTAISDLDERVRTAIATTPAGVAAQLWLSLIHNERVSGEVDENALLRGDIECFSDDRDYDRSDRLVFAALRSLTAMAQAPAHLLVAPTEASLQSAIADAETEARPGEEQSGRTLQKLIADLQRARASVDRYYDTVAEGALDAFGKALAEVDRWFVEILRKGEVDRCLKKDSTEVRMALIQIDMKKQRYGEDWRKHCSWMDLEIYDSMERHKERVAAREAQIRAEMDIDRIEDELERLSDIASALYKQLVDFPVTTVADLIAKIEARQRDDDDEVPIEALLADLHRVAQGKRRQPSATAGEG